jgi:hypothetical protein
VYYLLSVDEQAPERTTFDQILDELLRTRNQLARDFLVPDLEDQHAGRLVQLLERSAAPAAPPLPAPLNKRHVAALLCAQATQSGGIAVWLGEEGLYGAHVLRRVNGAIDALQVKEEMDGTSLPSLEDTQEAWRRVLGAPELQVHRVAASSVDGWSPLVSALENDRVPSERAWDQLQESRNLGEIRSTLLSS